MTILTETIRKVAGGYRIISHRTGKNLGTFASRGAAERRLAQLARFREAGSDCRWVAIGGRRVCLAAGHGGHGESLREAATDDCQWITKDGRHICITGGHGGHERGQAAPKSSKVLRPAGGATAISPIPGPLGPSRAQAVPSHTSTTAQSPSATTRASQPSTLDGPMSILGTLDPVSGKLILQPINDAEVLKERARQAAPLLQYSMDRIASSTPGVQNLGARSKNEHSESSKARLAEKLQKLPPNTISDYVGARLSFDTLAAQDRLYRAIAAEYPIVADENFLGNAKAAKGGYRARHLSILLPNGITAEIQMVPLEISQVQEEAHKDWNIIRAKDRMPLEQVQAAQVHSKTLMDTAWQKFMTRTGLHESVQSADCIWRTIGGRPVCIRAAHGHGKAGPAPAAEITTANVEHYRGDIRTEELPTDLWAVFDRAAFDALGPQARLIPLAQVVSPKNELADPKFVAGLKPDPRATVISRAAEAAAGRLAKRAPITVIERDGRYVVQDGNATVQALMLAGWRQVPAQLLRREASRQEARQGRAFLEFNPNHEPAGSPKGGQFAAGSGGGGGAATTPAPTEADLQRYQVLRRRWAEINNSLLATVDTPDSPESREKMRELKEIVKEIHGLNVDPGGIEGLGLPGGPRDVVIVGAGPGGLASGIMAGTDGLDALIIDKSMVPGGQAKFSSRIENFPGFPVGVTGERLASSMYEQLERLGTEGRLGVGVIALRYDPVTGLKTLTLADGSTIQTRAVILAGGLEFRTASFPGAGAKGVSYGDGRVLAQDGLGKAIAVLGGSNGAAQAALGAARSATHVTVISRSPISKSMSDYQVQALRNHPKITVLEGAEVDRVDQDAGGRMTAIRLKDGSTVPAAAVGVFWGSAPGTKWLGPSVSTRGGKIVTQPNYETNVPGVFAVGDIRDGSIGRIGAAVGEGQFAMRHVWDYFEQQRQARQEGMFSEEAQTPRRRPRDRAGRQAAWNALVDRVFDLDLANPYFGQTAEAEPSEGAVTQEAATQVGACRYLTIGGRRVCITGGHNHSAMLQAGMGYRDLYFGAARPGRLRRKALPADVGSTGIGTHGNTSGT